MISENTINAISKKNNEPEWLVKSRLNSFYTYKNSEKPAFFRYGLNIVLNFDYNLDSISKFDLTTNAPDVDNDEITVIDIRKAVNEFPELIKEYIFSLANDKDDFFIILNRALFSSGLFIRVKENINIDEPIIFNNFVNANKFSYNLIILEKNSRATFIEDLNSDKNFNMYNSSFNEIIVKENSVLNYGCINTLSNESYNHNIIRTIVKENGTMNCITGLFGSSFTKLETTTYLEGEYSNANTFGVFFGKNKQQFDIHARVYHKGKNAKSNMLTKGIVKDSSKSVYRGLVNVSEGAVNSDGYQKEDILILSENAEADSIPELEINNNDVRCTHGATISQIDKEKLFYLMSRGLSEEESRRLIVEGFFEPLIKNVQSEFIQDKFRKTFENLLKNEINFEFRKKGE